MATTTAKMRSITGQLVPNYLMEREEESSSPPPDRRVFTTIYRLRQRQSYTQLLLQSLASEITPGSNSKTHL